MVEKVAKLKPVGVNLDIPPSELPESVYSDVTNMTMRNQAAQRADGYNNAAGTLLHQCDYVIGNRRPENQYFFVYPGDTGAGIKIAVTDLFTHEDITPVPAPTESVPGLWTGGELNGLLLLCNGIDPPWYWDGDTGNPVLDLPNFPVDTIAGWIRPFKYFAIAGNITVAGENFENQFYWSATVLPGEPPTDWTPLPSNDAGDNILASTPGSLIDGHALRDHFILAKNHSLYLLNYVAGQFIFTVHKLSVTTGALTSNCMAEETGFLYIFSDGDIVRTDGQSVVSIATQQVKRTVFGTMNQAAFESCFVVNYVAQDEIWFCYPTGANVVPNAAVVYDHIQGVWGSRALPAANMIAPGIVSNSSSVVAWDADSEAWSDDFTRWAQSGISEIEDGLLIASDSEDLLFGVGLDELANGQEFVSAVEKASMDFGALEYIKYVNQVWPYVVGVKGDVCVIRIGTQMFDSEPIAWGPQMEFIIGVDTKVDFGQSGRLISIRIEGPGASYWSIQSFDIRYNVQGLW